jgi:CRISPR-associated endoribonuclease Cas6
VEVEEPPKFEGRCLFQTLSPIVASTGVRKGSKMEHRFLSPDEDDFWRVLETNLRRKALVLDIVPSREPLSFELVGRWRSKLFRVHGTMVRGFEMKFQVTGDAELLRIGYEAGFGERNTQGFGMVKMLRQT